MPDEMVTCPSCWSWEPLGRRVSCKRCGSPLLTAAGRRVDGLDPAGAGFVPTSQLMGLAPQRVSVEQLATAAEAEPAVSLEPAAALISARPAPPGARRFSWVAVVRIWLGIGLLLDVVNSLAALADSSTDLVGVIIAAAVSIGIGMLCFWAAGFFNGRVVLLLLALLGAYADRQSLTAVIIIVIWIGCLAMSLLERDTLRY